MTLLSLTPIQVAEAIFQMNMLSHYDRQHIAMMCEKAGMYQRALEHYTDISDIRRCMLHSHDMSPEFLTNYIGKVGDPARRKCKVESVCRFLETVRRIQRVWLWS